VRETQLQALAMQQETAAAVFPEWTLNELCAIAALSGDWAAAQTYARQTLGAREEASELPIALTGWYETEALLRGGDKALACSGLQRLE
jgi:hypothetical protein